MAFPEDPINVTTELYYDSVWNDITSDVRADQGITIVRGRSDEQSTASPSTCQFKLDNTSHNYSPKNPTSTLYGKIGNNTPVRTKIAPSTGEAVALSLAGATIPNHGARVSTPNHSDYAITGDLDVRMDIDPGQWRWNQYVTGYHNEFSPMGVKTLMLASKWYGTAFTVDQRSWVFGIHYDGTLRLRFSDDGTDNVGHFFTYASTVAIPVDTGRLAVRVALDTDNGAGGHDVRFYTASTIGGVWTQLGDTITTAGTVNIFSSSADMVVGAAHEGQVYTTVPSAVTYTGLMYACQVYADLAGSDNRVDLDFTSYDTLTRSFTDSDGHVWTLHGAAEFVNSATRHCGEISDWSPDWDKTGTDVVVPVTASGILRRLKQGDKPLDSPIFKAYTTNDLDVLDTLVDYWPCEDEESATTIASGLEDGVPMKLGIIEGFPIRDTDFASYSDFAGSKPVTEFGITTAEAELPPLDSTGFVQLNALVHVPSSGISNSDVQILNVRTDAEGLNFAIELNPSGSLRLEIFGAEGLSLYTSSYIVFDMNGEKKFVSLILEQNGPDIDWAIFVRNQDDLSDDAGFDDTFSSHTLGAPDTVWISKSGNMEGTAVGHVALRNTKSVWGAVWFGPSNTYSFGLTDDALKGQEGERVGYRIIRICQENNVPIRFIGDPDDTPYLGEQPDGNIVDVLEDAAKVDGGVLTEARSFLGIEYYTRKSIYNQTSALTVDYDNADFSEIPRPKADDRYIRNDVTVQRSGGSSRRSVQKSGPLNVNSPIEDPEGAGLYDEDVTLNLRSDGYLINQASWRRHLGTIDEERYPSFVINLARRTNLTDDALSLRLGNRIMASDLPVWVKSEQISQILRGYTETIRNFEHTFDFKTSASGGYNVAILGDADTKANTSGSELAEAIDTTQSSVLVTTTKGYVWTEDASEFSFDVLAGGEAMTVSDIGPGVIDTFTRSETDTWGNSDSGQTYLLYQGIGSAGNSTDSGFDVSGTQGVITQSTTDTHRLAVLDVSTEDFDFVCEVGTGTTPTGNRSRCGLQARFADSDNFQYAILDYLTTGEVYLYLGEVVAGVAATIAGEYATGFTATQRLNLRFAGRGDKLKAKVWSGSSEPNVWHLRATSANWSRGKLGVHAYRYDLNTNANLTAEFDNLTVYNPQEFTVTRSANGVTKSHTVSTNLELRNVSYFGL